MRTKRTRLGIFAIALTFAVGALAWTAQHYATGRAPMANAKPAAPSIKLAVARAGDFVDRIDAPGRIGAPLGSTAKLTFAQAGIVASIDAHVGESIRAGQTLATLERASLGTAVAQARAETLAADASYGGGAIPRATVGSATAKLSVAGEKLATLERGGPAALSSRISAQSVARQAALKVAGDRTTLTRVETLFAGGVLARKDVAAARAVLDNDLADERAADAKVSAAGSDFTAALEGARADVATARTDLATARAQQGVLGGAAEAARAKLDAARIAYTNGVLIAATDGVVLSILKHPGEAADPSAPVIEVGPAIGHGVTLSVPAAVARRIAVGDAATLRFAATREHVTHGHVSAVVPAVDPATQLATVTLSGAPADAVPGDAVTANIVVGRLAAIIVPSSAIVQDPQTGKTVVFVRDAHPKAGESGFTLREVTLRASDATSAAIASGLRAGETIAAQGGYTLLAPAGA